MIGIEIETTHKKKFSIDHEDTGLQTVVYGSHDGKVWEANCPDRKFTSNAVAILADMMHVIPNGFTAEIEGCTVSVEIDLEEEGWTVDESLDYIRKAANWLADGKPIECKAPAEPQKFRILPTYAHAKILIPERVHQGKLEVSPFYVDVNCNNFIMRGNTLERLPGTQKYGTVLGEPE